jgi:hypothetical protein
VERCRRHWERDRAASRIEQHLKIDCPLGKIGAEPAAPE